MDLHLLALQLMAAQGLLGAFDTLYHHELTEALPLRAQAVRELRIHSVRALVYGLLFIGLAGWRWYGAWAAVLFMLFAIEVGLTLWDFVVEDRTRLLPATERVTHTLLAINGGAFIALLGVAAWQARGLPSALVWHPQGWLSVFLALCGAGVTLSGLRDAAAVRTLARWQAMAPGATRSPRFGTGPETVLVTGATGFIGQQLVQALLADGHQVIAWTRSARRAAFLFDGQVRCYERLDDIPAHAAIDVVVNLAGARVLGWPWTPRRRQTLLTSRVETTRRLVAWLAARPHRPRLLLSASAIGYYGVQPLGDDARLTESSPSQDIFMSQLCQQWEAAAAGACDFGVPVACMRFGLVLGHGGALPAMLLPVQCGVGGPLGSGRQWYSWIHIHDLLRALAHLWAGPQPGAQRLQTFNFTAPGALHQAEFARIACRLLHRPYGFPMPAAPVRGLLGEQATVLLDGQRVEPGALLAGGFRFSYPQLAMALQQLCGVPGPASDSTGVRPE